MQHDNLNRYLVEGIGLLDLPVITLGRRNPCKHIWRRYVTPIKRQGIEPTTGLPRSFIDIMACLNSPEAEDMLLSWSPSDKAQHILQYQFWEAFRLAIILVCRDVSPKANTDCQDRETASLESDTESIIMRILSNIQALQNATDDPFHPPLRYCIIWPLFIAALHTDNQSATRPLLVKEFEAFVETRNKPIDRTALAILLEVWTQRESMPSLSPYELAYKFATEMEVELHFY